MELQFQRDVVQCLKAAVREVRNVELTQEVRLSDGMPDIGRVVASWGQPVLRSKEWQADLVSVSGGVMVWILYVPEDGTPPRCAETWVPFQLKWELGETDKDGPIRILPLLRFVDSRSTSARKMMIRAGVAAFGEALAPMQAQVYTPGELPEDIQLHQTTYPVRLQKEAGEKTFLLDEDLQISSGLPQPERILSYTVLPQLTEKRVAGDKLIMRGTGKLRVVYRCSEGKVHTTELEIPISQYAQLEDTYGNDAQADIVVGVTSLELTQNEGPLLRLKCGLVAQYLISDRFLADLIEDAYSTKRELHLNMEELRLPTILEQRTEPIIVNQHLQGISGEIVDLSFLPDFPRQSCTGENVTLDLSGQFQMVYYGADNSLQGTTARWEGTQQIRADSNCNMSFLVLPNGSAQVVFNAEELNLNTQIKLELTAQNITEIPMVSALTVGKAYEMDCGRPSLILCRSNGENLWTIAKRCGSTVNEIQRMNRLSDQPQENQMLLIPIP